LLGDGHLFEALHDLRARVWARVWAMKWAEGDIEVEVPAAMLAHVARPLSLTSLRASRQAVLREGCQWRWKRRERRVHPHSGN
jgi:hypothetical protein